MKLPKLDPLPGRVVVRLVNRLQSAPGTKIEVSDKYQCQPYIGKMVAIGEPLNETQSQLREELIARDKAGHRAIFTWGSGTEYSTDEMINFKTMRSADANPADPASYLYPFAWMANLRVFRIEDFATTLDGGDYLGGWDPKSVEVEVADA